MVIPQMVVRRGDWMVGKRGQPRVQMMG